MQDTHGLAAHQTGSQGFMMRHIYFTCSSKCVPLTGLLPSVYVPLLCVCVLNAARVAVLPQPDCPTTERRTPTDRQRIKQVRKASYCVITTSLVAQNVQSSLSVPQAPVVHWRSALQPQQSCTATPAAKYTYA